MKKEKAGSIIKKITWKIVEEYRPQRIILFGSAARGQMRDNSDLDLLVIKDTKKGFYDRVGELLRIVRNITPKPPIDFLVYTPSEFKQMKTESYFVKEEIINKGKILYG